MIVTFAILCALAHASSQTVTCVSQTRNIIAQTDFIPKQFSYMSRQPQTYVYGKLENDQVMSLTNVFYIKEKDCSKGAKKVSGPFGNMFALGPYEPDRSLLMTESVFLKESDDYVMSIEI